MSLVQRLTGKKPTKQTFTGPGTYTPALDVKWIKVRMIGGGSGGAGSGNSPFAAPNFGAGGGNTTFGGSLLIAGGGTNNGSTGISGSNTVNAPAIAIINPPAQVGSFFTATPGAVSMYVSAPPSPPTPFGFGGTPGVNSVGGNASANTGAGGGGGGTSGGTVGAVDRYSGAAGGNGGYIEAIIHNPLTIAASFAITIGTGGAGGSPNTNGFAGGVGGSGYILIEEYYS